MSFLIEYQIIVISSSPHQKYPSNLSKLNLTLTSAWINTFAEKNHINFSQVLQDSLTAVYQKT